MALSKAGIKGYRLHLRNVPGRPDIAFPKSKLAVFVNGCFWHRCPECNLRIPKTHQEFWKKKFQLNQERDKRKIEEVTSAGWRVITVWEHEVKTDLAGCITRIKRVL